MAPSRTSTVKSKHAAAKSGIANSKASKRGAPDGIVKSSSKKSSGNKGALPNKQIKDKGRDALIKKLRNPKKRSYTEEELGIPKLNTITPVGVIKPKGKKKGKVFVDDRVCATFLSLPRGHRHPVWLKKIANVASNYRKV